MRIEPLLRGAVGGLAAAAWLAAVGAAQSAAAQSAGDLRTALNRLLQEHAFLTAAVTGATLGKRADEAKAATAALDRNSLDLARNVGSVYGDDTGRAFLELWRQHIVFLVDYTRATSAKHRAMREDAVRNLAGYAEDFAAFLASANPHLPAPALTELLRAHVAGLTALVDAQAGGDAAAAYTRLRELAGHMQRIGDPLAAAIVKQFPDRFPVP
jgi:hypothetical protein